MRASTGATVGGLVLAAYASIAHAQILAQPPTLCPASQVGMPCNANQYDLCLPTLCWKMQAPLDDAGVPLQGASSSGLMTVGCSQCTACVQADCRAVGCVNGGVCTYQGTPQTPCGGFGYGTATQADQWVVSNPEYVCYGADGSGGASSGPAPPPVLETPPTCPDLTGWTDLCGAQSSGDGGTSSSGSGTGSAAGGSASSSGSGSSGAVGDVGSAAAGGTSAADASPPAPRARTVDTDSGHAPDYVVLGHGACAIGPRARGWAGSWSWVLALTLLIKRRVRQY
jgi:hypothetical protein